MSELPNALDTGWTMGWRSIQWRGLQRRRNVRLARLQRMWRVIAMSERHAKRRGPPAKQPGCCWDWRRVWRRWPPCEGCHD